MSRPAGVEYAAAGLAGWSPEQIERKLAGAPAWVRAGIRHPARPAGTRPTARAAVPDIRRPTAWLCGTVCPGVSNPCYSSQDRRTIVEQFTPNAWRSLVRQTQESTRPIPLTLDHGGPTICTTRSLDVVFSISFRVGERIGPEFHARLPATRLGEQVLEEAADGCGVSLGFVPVRQWITERDGVGPVRVVDELRIDHVAILPRSAGKAPCFPAARAYGGRGRWIGPPVALVDNAHLHAWPILKRQAGVKC